MTAFKPGGGAKRTRTPGDLKQLSCRKSVLHRAERTALAAAGDGASGAKHRARGERLRAR